MKICVIGLGYVGAVTAACLARDGHQVLGVDLDHAKLSLIRQGHAPIVEKGLDDVTKSAIDSRNLVVGDRLEGATRDCELFFVCVGTPSASNGSQDLSAVRRVMEQLGRELRDRDDFPVVVLRSTVYPGSTENIVRPILEKESGARAGKEFGLCFQPEFLREGSSVSDFYNPPFTVVGSDCQRSVNRLKEVFGTLPGSFIVTSFSAAEMLKLTCNAFHALKISFANEVGRLGKSLGVDSREVMRFVCMDTNLNISPAYLRPGFAYGGSCLPKDLSAILYLARQTDLDLPVLSSMRTSNDLHIQHAADMVMRAGSRKVGFVGLSFKPGTDDLRDSPLVTLAETLIGKGYDLRIFDPAVNLARLIGSNKRFIEERIPHIEKLLVTDLRTVVGHAGTLVIGQDHADLAEAMEERGPARPVVIDLQGMPPESVTPGPDYQGICW